MHIAGLTDQTMQRCSIILLAGLFFSGAGIAAAHDVFAACVQHRVGIAVSAKHLDVTVQLTFFEEGSKHERQHMDSDSDGRISRTEIDAYLQTLEPELASAVSLQVGGHPIILAPLSAAELELLSEDRADRGVHRLTLLYFAPTPPALATGTELLLEDRLWPSVRALVSIHVEGKDACRLEVLPIGDPVLPPAKNNEARCFKARVLSPPKSQPPTATPAIPAKSPAQIPNSIPKS